MVGILRPAGAHLRDCWPRVIVGLCLTPANLHDPSGAEELLDLQRGFMLADRNYWSPGTGKSDKSGGCSP